MNVWFSTNNAILKTDLCISSKIFVFRSPKMAHFWNKFGRFEPKHEYKALSISAFFHLSCTLMVFHKRNKYHFRPISLKGILNIDSALSFTSMNYYAQQRFQMSSMQSWKYAKHLVYSKCIKVSLKMHNASKCSFMTNFAWSILQFYPFSRLFWHFDDFDTFW